jgi:hypothetical protein
MKCCCGDFSAISLDMLGTDEVSKDVMVATTTIHVAVEGNNIRMSVAVQTTQFFSVFLRIGSPLFLCLLICWWMKSL